jgi:CRP/FNR family transcriptional regulator, cyclic AMP receptor protein
MALPALPSTDQASAVRRSLSRAATADELRAIPWLGRVEAEHRPRVAAELRVLEVAPGELLCKVGRAAVWWLGVLDGLLKMSNDSSDGLPITFTGVTSGGWFGEGTVLKNEVYRYNIQALRPSLVAGIPASTFHWLLGRSIAFNGFVMNQLNERLGQFIAAREIDRLTHPDERVARNLAALFHPVLYPGVGERLHITQQELGYLVGLGRQRVNRALTALHRAGVIRVEYGGVRVLDLEGLRRYTSPGGGA